MKNVIIFLIVSLITVRLFAQTPEMMSYQAIIRNSSNVLITNKQVGIRVSILQGSMDGTVVYSETQTVSTNSNGLFSLEIGGGAGFDTIDWPKGTYFIKTETDPLGGANYTITGISQLLSVPYALHAKAAENIGNTGISMLKELIYEELLNARLNGIVKDVDGNTYKTIKIGTQVWMAENLKTTKFNNGNVIPGVTDNEVWNSMTIPGYCWYNNDSATFSYPYGALYNWYTVNIGNLCPVGWHVPSDAEWSILSDYLGGTAVAGDKLKEIGTKHWLGPNTGATNESGFTALPSGIRDGGIFYFLGNTGYWWSSSEYDTYWSYYRYIDYSGSYLLKISYQKKLGMSVRCLRN